MAMAKSHLCPFQFQSYFLPYPASLRVILILQGKFHNLEVVPLFSVDLTFPGFITQSASNFHAEQCLLSHTKMGKAVSWKWKDWNNGMTSSEFWFKLEIKLWLRNSLQSQNCVPKSQSSKKDLCSVAADVMCWGHLKQVIFLLTFY